MTAEGDNEQEADGPLTTYVRANWKSAWEAIAQGGTGEGFIIAIEGYLVQNRHRAAPVAEEILSDLENAERLHIFHKVNYQHHLQGRQHRASQLLRLANEAANQINSLTIHITKSLTLAHGAAVLATLAYVGQGHPQGYAFTSIIGVCALGFLSSLLGAYLGISANSKLMSTLLPLTDPQIAESIFNEKAKVLSDIQEHRVRYTWPSWASVALLVVAIFLALFGLWPNAKA